MKQKVLALVVAVLLLAGCAPKQTLEQSVASEADSAQTSQTENSIDTSNLTYVGLKTWSLGSGNSEGYYECIENVGGTWNMMYTDYASKQQIHLCAQPSCNHDSESCTSWLPGNGMGGVLYFPVATESCVFLIDNSLPAKVDVMQLDGSECKTLLEFEGTANISYNCAYNDTYLFLLVCQTEETLDAAGNARMEQTYKTLALNYHTGEVKELFRSAPETDTQYAQYTICGVSENGFLTGSFTSNREYGSTEATTVSAVELPFDGSAPRTIPEITVYPTFWRVYDDIAYIINDLQLSKINLATGEQKVLTTTLPGAIEKMPNVNVKCWATFCDKVGDYILLSAYQGDVNNQSRTALYAVHCETGEVFEVPQYITDSMKQRPMDIVVQNGDMLLVAAKYEFHQLDGRVGPSKFFTNGMISAADFLAGKDNYQWIDTQRQRIE